MIPISSYSQFLFFIDDLKVYEKETGGSTAFKLYAQFPGQMNSVMDYGETLFDNGRVSHSGMNIDEVFQPYFNGRLVPYYVKETNAIKVDGQIIKETKTILTYAPVTNVKYYGVELEFGEDKFLAWRGSKSA